jgi:hypothetical protein
MQTVEFDDLISQREASRRYGMTPYTIGRRVRRGELQTYLNPMDDRVKLVRASDVEALMEPRPIERVATENATA